MSYVSRTFPYGYHVSTSSFFEGAQSRIKLQRACKEHALGGLCSLDSSYERPMSCGIEATPNLLQDFRLKVVSEICPSKKEGRSAMWASELVHALQLRTAGRTTAQRLMLHPTSASRSVTLLPMGKTRAQAPTSLKRAHRKGGSCSLGLGGTSEVPSCRSGYYFFFKKVLVTARDWCEHHP